MSAYGDYPFIAALKLTRAELQQYLHDGRLYHTTHDACYLYNDLVSNARFGDPMRHESVYCEDSLELVYCYVIYRLIMMSVLSFTSAYPKYVSSWMRGQYPKFPNTSIVNKYPYNTRVTQL